MGTEPDSGTANKIHEDTVGKLPLVLSVGEEDILPARLEAPQPGKRAWLRALRQALIKQAISRNQGGEDQELVHNGGFVTGRENLILYLDGILNGGRKVTAIFVPLNMGAKENYQIFELSEDHVRENLARTQQGQEKELSSVIFSLPDQSIVIPGEIFTREERRNLDDRFKAMDPNSIIIVRVRNGERIERKEAAQGTNLEDVEEDDPDVEAKGKALEDCIFDTEIHSRGLIIDIYQVEARFRKCLFPEKTPVQRLNESSPDPLRAALLVIRDRLQSVGSKPTEVTLIQDAERRPSIPE